MVARSRELKIINQKSPSSEQLARLFETILKRYPKASAIGFATIRGTDEGGLSRGSESHDCRRDARNEGA